MAEDRRAAVGRVAADALEDAGPVVEPVAENVDLGVFPGDELTVHPDPLGLLHVCLRVGLQGRPSMPEPGWRMVGRMSSSCARCGAVTSAGARFCAACGAPLEAPGGPERKLATLVFADLVGSTELVAERDPEDAGACSSRSSRSPARCSNSTAAGSRSSSATPWSPCSASPASTVTIPTARSPRRSRWSPGSATPTSGLELRVGIESGEVLASSGGGDLAVTGEPAHAAARLQQAAAPGEVLVGERAAGACRTRGARRASTRSRRRGSRSRCRPGGSASGVTPRAARRPRSSAAAASSRSCGSPTCGPSASASRGWCWSPARPGSARRGWSASCSATLEAEDRRRQRS